MVFQGDDFFRADDWSPPKKATTQQACRKLLLQQMFTVVTVEASFFKAINALSPADLPQQCKNVVQEQIACSCPTNAEEQVIALNFTDSTTAALKA